MSAKISKATQQKKQPGVGSVRNAVNSNAKNPTTANKARQAKPEPKASVDGRPLHDSKHDQSPEATAAKPQAVAVSKGRKKTVLAIPHVEAAEAPNATPRHGGDALPVADTAPVAAVNATSVESGDTAKIQRQGGTETKQAARADLGERYHTAAAEVGRLRKEFLAALDEKAALLGVARVGEAVPVRTDEIRTIDTEIGQVRAKMEELLAKKKQLKGASPALEAINGRINELRRLREAARVEKQAAMADASAHMDRAEGQQ